MSGLMTSDALVDRFARCVAIVAAHNEEATIAAVVAEARHSVPSVVVVDDGSSDRTGERARHAGATVVRHAECRGYDAALLTGFAWAKASGFAFMVTLDGDGEHDPRLLDAMLSPLVADEADIVVGYRPHPARVSEWLFALYSRARFGLRDPLCGMKAYRVELFRDAGEPGLVGSIGTGLALRALRDGARLCQVAVPIRERRGVPRFGIGLRPNLRILRAMWQAMRARPTPAGRTR